MKGKEHGADKALISLAYVGIHWQVAAQGRKSARANSVAPSCPIFLKDSRYATDDAY